MKKDFEKGKSVDKISPLFERVFCLVVESERGSEIEKRFPPTHLTLGRCQTGVFMCWAVFREMCTWQPRGSGGEHDLEVLDR